MRNSVDFLFNRNRDYPLHLFGGLAGDLSDDPNLHVRDVGKGFQREFLISDDTPGNQ